MVVLLTGGTGLVGTALVKKLKQRGHEVRILVRAKSDDPGTFLWNYQKKQIDPGALNGVDCIVHLAGASIAKRWTEKYKEEILSSRVDSAQFLREQLEKTGQKLKAFISASGTNYYGTVTTSKVFTEQDPAVSKDFLSLVCEKWEAAADIFSPHSERIVKIRTAPVLSKDGGSFKPLKLLSDFHLSSPVGSGRQYFPWIHIEDLVSVYLHSIENPQIEGALNAVASEIPTNREFMKTLAQVNGKLFIPLAVPSVVLRGVLGEMSSILLEGSRVSNQKMEKAGIPLLYPKLEPALRKLLY